MRDERIDILRFIGLAMIILAHVSPPSWLFQIRNFDVPLMVLVSGVAFGLSYKGEMYGSYLWKRIKRLVFPAWTFLSIYFLLMLIPGFPKDLPEINKILGSYFLLDGIGYVWIIRVFLLVALVAPLVFKLHQKIPSSNAYFLLIVLIYAIYEALVFIIAPYLESEAGNYFESIILYTIPYIILFAIGLRMFSLSDKTVITTGLSLWLIFIVTCVVLYELNGRLVYTQSFKYPPQAYYLLYALAVSFTLWLLVEKTLPFLKKIPVLYPFVEFIAQNSLWVYLWHIPFADVLEMDFYIKYPIVFLLASLITFIQVQVVKNVLIPKIKSKNSQKNIYMLLTG